MMAARGTGMERVWTGLGAGAAFGLLVGAIVALVLRLMTDIDVSWLYVVALAALIGAVIGGALALAHADREPFRLDEWAPLRPETILRQATRRYREAGWEVEETSDTAMTFTRRARPNAGVVVLLLLLLVVPGVLYWFLAKRTLRTTILAEPVIDGSEVTITVNQTGDGGRVSAVAFFNSLHDLVSEPGPARSSN
jgi:MFS family permease